MPEPRAYTAEETRDKFLKTLASIAEYWGGLKDQSPMDAVNGVVFSMLALIDGSNMGFPGLRLYPETADEDEAYHRGLGENYYDRQTLVNDAPLHELWFEYQRS